MLALALGAKTVKMNHGHHGANHPVKDLDSGRVMITSQNHGFVVDPSTLPSGVHVTHENLFDHSNEGIAVEGKPIFSVQYHPEASPGPHDADHHFARFVAGQELDGSPWANELVAAGRSTIVRRFEAAKFAQVLTDGLDGAAPEPVAEPSAEDLLRQRLGPLRDRIRLVPMERPDRAEPLLKAVQEAVQALRAVG